MKNATPKRLLSLVMACVMLLGLAACGGSAETPAAEAPATAPTPVEEIEWLSKDGSLPLVAEGTEKTLSMYVRLEPNAPAPEELWMYSFIEEAMNINLEVTAFTTENEDEILSLAFASGDLPDLIIGCELTTGELVKYGVDEGLLVDLAPYLNEEYMPRLTAIYEAKPDFKKIVTDADGHVWSVGFISDPTTAEQVNRAFLNYDWLDELGLEAPATLDELTAIFEAFKGMGSDIIPVGGYYCKSTYDNPMMYFLNAFGYITNDPTGMTMALRDGEPVLPIADREAFGAFLEYMNMLYTKGYIHPDFFSMDATTANAVKSEGRNGFLTQAPFVFVGDDYKQWWGAPALTSEYQTAPEWPQSDTSIRHGRAVVTSACDDVELAVAFLDWWYNNSDNAEELNYSLSQWGPEQGYSYMGDVAGYTIEPGGEPEYIDLEGYTKNEYWIQRIQLWPKMTLGTRLDGDLSTAVNAVRPGTPEILAQYDDAADSRADYASGQFHFEAAMQETVAKVVVPTFPIATYLPTDTMLEMNELYQQFTSYAEIEIAKFITGARPLSELED